LSEADLHEANYNPAYVKLLHAAYIGQQLLNKQMSAAKPPARAAAVPVTQLGRGAQQATRPDLRKVAEGNDGEAYRRLREEQLRKQRAS
jgi:hypothetical protein